MESVDDRATAFIAEVQRALAASRAEAGMPPVASPDLADVAAAVRESGFGAALNNITAAAISSSVSYFFVLTVLVLFIFVTVVW